MREVRGEREKGFVNQFFMALENALRNFEAKVKTFMDTEDPSQAFEALIYAAQIRKTLTAIETCTGLKEFHQENPEKEV